MSGEAAPNETGPRRALLTRAGALPAVPDVEWIPWDPAEPPPPAHVAVVFGLAEVQLATGAPLHLLAILDPTEVAALGPRSRRLADFVVAPVRPEELVARLSRLCALPPWGLQQIHALLVHAVERTSDLIEITTPDIVYKYVNRAYETVLGWSPEEAIGRTPAALVASGLHDPAFLREVVETVNGGRTWSGVIVSRSRSGRLVHLDSTITPIVDEDGVITHQMSVQRDITADRERQQALVEARDAALAASRAKSEFLANMSHEPPR